MCRTPHRCVDHHHGRALRQSPLQDRDHQLLGRCVRASRCDRLGGRHRSCHRDRLRMQPHRWLLTPTRATRSGKSGRERKSELGFRPGLSFCSVHDEYESFITFQRTRSHRTRVTGRGADHGLYAPTGVLANLDRLGRRWPANVR
jgi:hypothetical protein